MNSGVCVYTDMYMYIQCYQHVDQLNHMMFIYEIPCILNRFKKQFKHFNAGFGRW